jgi:hypothetical protein
MRIPCCGVLLLLFGVQHMADAIHTTDQTDKNVYHVTQFHPITVLEVTEHLAIFFLLYIIAMET